MRCAARGSPRLVVSVLSAFASLLLLLLLPLAAAPARAFGGGDFVPTARRAQFHGRRTAWHDLLGRYVKGGGGRGAQPRMRAQRRSPRCPFA